MSAVRASWRCGCMMGWMLLSATQANSEFLPQQVAKDPTRSVVLFEDPAVGLLFKSDARTIGTVAVSFPLATSGENVIYALAGVEANLRNEGLEFNAEALDLRVAINWVHPLSEQLHLSLGVSHTSGHVMDDVQEKSLVPLNLGIDGFPIRLNYQYSRDLRLGLHGMVAVSSDPATRVLFGGIFSEYYFAHTGSEAGFLIGSDFYFPERTEISLSAILELIYRYRNANWMFGYHAGADPRLKQQLYLESRNNFWLAGFKVEL